MKDTDGGSHHGNPMTFTAYSVSKGSDALHAVHYFIMYISTGLESQMLIVDKNRDFPKSKSSIFKTSSLMQDFQFYFSSKKGITFSPGVRKVNTLLPVDRRICCARILEARSYSFFSASFDHYSYIKTLQKLTFTSISTRLSDFKLEWC